MPLVVHYLAYLQSVHGLRCYDTITRTRNVSEYMIVLALCLVLRFAINGHQASRGASTTAEEPLISQLSMDDCRQWSYPVSARQTVHLPGKTVRPPSGGDDVTGRQPGCGRDFAR